MQILRQLFPQWPTTKTAPAVPSGEPSLLNQMNQATKQKRSVLNDITRKGIQRWLSSARKPLQFISLPSHLDEEKKSYPKTFLLLWSTKRVCCLLTSRVFEVEAKMFFFGWHFPVSPSFFCFSSTCILYITIRVLDMRYCRVKTSSHLNSRSSLFFLNFFACSLHHRHWLNNVEYLSYALQN